MGASKGSTVVTETLQRAAKVQLARPAAEAPALSLAGIYREHVKTVWRWVQRLGGPTLDTEDVVQEVFLVVHRQLPTFRGDAQLTTWLYRITANVVHRKRQRERWRRFLRGTPEETAGHLPSAGRGPAEKLEEQQATRKLHAALEHVKPKHREVLVLFELEGHSGEEIANLLGAKVSTVWVWLHRARAELTKALEGIEKREGARR